MPKIVDKLADYLRSHSVQCEVKSDYVEARFEYTTKLKYTGKDRLGGGHWLVRIRTFKQARLWLGY